MLGTLVHTCGGAAFGWAFARLGGRGLRDGVTAGVVENTALWPLMAVLAPDWFRDPRAFANAVVGHAFYGALLGLFLEELDGRGLAD